eukprot:8039512-Prorocentrum_lima.AAC.1
MIGVLIPKVHQPNSAKYISMATTTQRMPSFSTRRTHLKWQFRKLLLLSNPHPVLPHRSRALP